jgi:hypothetical protein
VTELANNTVPTVDGKAIRKNSSNVNPTQACRPNPTATTVKLSNLFGVFREFDPSVKHQAANAIENTSAASMNIAKIKTGDVWLVTWMRIEGRCI